MGGNAHRLLGGLGERSSRAAPPEQRRDELRRAGRAVGLDGRSSTGRSISSAIAAAMTSGGDVAVAQHPARPVALQPVADVALLLEVVLERDVQERPPCRRELHRRREAALDDREVAGDEVAVQVRDERPHLDAGRRVERRRVDPRPGDDDHPQARGRAAPPSGYAAMTRRSSASPTPLPPTATITTRSSGR